MSEMEMNNEVETEEFTDELSDELSDEALDREGGGSLVSFLCTKSDAGS